MIPGCGGVRGQEQDIGQVVVEVEIEGGEVQHGRDQHDPVQVQAMPVLQITGQPGGARGAVTLADQELGREPAPVAGGVQADEITHRLDVLLEAVPLFGLLALHRAAVPRADRVDEHQVGLVQQRMLIFGQLEGRLGQFPIDLQYHPARTEHAQMHPDRGGPGPAVERERDRTF